MLDRKKYIGIIQTYLTEKARRRSVVPYSRIYQLFPEGTSDTDVWNTFEEACKSICKPSEAIYGALMIKKDTGLPSTGFFDIFKNTRREMYLEITNGEHLQANQLSVQQMEAITKIELEKVHSHAINT
jgi:hypothetical protein